jgi:hypothetical protein
VASWCNKINHFHQQLSDTLLSLGFGWNSKNISAEMEINKIGIRTLNMFFRRWVRYHLFHITYICTPYREIKKSYYGFITSYFIESKIREIAANHAIKDLFVQVKKIFHMSALQMLFFNLSTFVLSYSSYFKNTRYSHLPISWHYICIIRAKVFVFIH